MDLIDGNTNTCLQITSHTMGRATSQLSLDISNMCMFKSNVITLAVTMETMATCHDLRNILYMGRPAQGWLTDQFTMCDIMSDNQSGNRRQCVMKCECSFSADQCSFKIYTGFHRHTIIICEITAS